MSSNTDITRRTSNPTEEQNEQMSGLQRNVSVYDRKIRFMKTIWFFLLPLNFLAFKFFQSTPTTFDTTQIFTLSTESKFLKLWYNQSFSDEINAYIFNVTNPEEVANGRIPIFEEVGPFVYDNIRPYGTDEINSQDSVDAPLDQFYKPSDYIFNAEKSHGLSENDVLTVLNFMALSIPYSMMKGKTDLLFSATKSIDESMKNTKSLIVNTTIRAILFDGIKEFLARKNDFSDESCLHDCFIENSNFWNEDEYILENCNGEDKKHYYEENDQSYLTDSSYYHEYHNRNKNDVNGVFVSQNFTFRFDSKIEIHGGDIYRFTTSMGSELSPNSKDKCSYVFEGRCLEEFGYILSRYNNTILFISNPHFYMNNSELIVDGFNPDKKKHMMFGDVHPDTLGLIQFNYRSQYNLLQITNSSLKLFPLFWIDEVLALQEDNIKRLNNNKTGSPYFGLLVTIGFVVVWYFRS